MSDTSNCRCDTFLHPAPITNPPGRSTLLYRVGNYTSFRHAMLLTLPIEKELLDWKPTPSGDLALQLIEWWAYLADILTFYNERVANEDYLRTAGLQASVQRLIRILGYRPRPGIGARATLAALVTAKKPFTIPQAFAVQSKPGPGKQPQIFELDTTVSVQPPGSVSADPVPTPGGLGGDGAVLVRGTVKSVKSGDSLLLVENNWGGTNFNYAYSKVSSIAIEPDPRGVKNTRITFTASPGLPSEAEASNYKLLRAAETTALWQGNGSIGNILINNGDGTGTAHLRSLSRDIHPGDMVLFDAPAPPGPQLASVTAYAEELWYANSAADPPATPPDPSITPGIPILHSVLTFRPPFSGTADRSTLVVRYAWQEVGQLMDTPPTTVTASTTQLVAVNPANFPAGSAQVVLEDAIGNGEPATGFVGAASTNLMRLSNLPENPPVLQPPINVFFNLLAMSRGKTVLNEILGSGDASVAGQEFVLKKSPLTYLLSASSASGANYTSTLRVWVNGVEWTEVSSFLGQPKDAAIFVTREDETGQTHVQFGDGISGARLPSGVNNVVAQYRFGSGAESPAAGQLTTIVNAVPGLGSVRNPVAAVGGADPEPASQIRRCAPLSVLAFSRAVSGDDYEAIAASTPGVARAGASWGFDSVRQRTLVTVYVGNDSAAVAAAQTALRADSDPNRPLEVMLAQAVPVRLSFTLLVDPKYIIADVQTAVTTALLDPDIGLFGTNRIGIGEVIYVSRIYQTCLSVPGVFAMEGLMITAGFLSTFPIRFFIPRLVQFGPFGINFPISRFERPFRLDPGEGGYFSLLIADLSISAVANPNA
jgi:hypothetical protein